MISVSGNADHSPKQSYSTSQFEKFLALYITPGHSYFRSTRCLINLLLFAGVVTILIAETRIRLGIGYKIGLFATREIYFIGLLSPQDSHDIARDIVLQSVFDRVFKK